VPRRKKPGQDIQKKKDVDRTSGSSHSSRPLTVESRAYDNYSDPCVLDISCRSGTATGSSHVRVAMAMGDGAKPQKSTLRPKKDRNRKELDASTTTALTHQSGSQTDGTVLLSPLYATHNAYVECAVAADMSSISTTRGTPPRNSCHHTFENEIYSQSMPLSIQAPSNMHAMNIPSECNRSATMVPCPFSLSPSLSVRPADTRASRSNQHKHHHARTVRSGRKEEDASIILAARRQALMAQAKFYGADHTDTNFTRQQLCNEMALANGRLPDLFESGETKSQGRTRQNSLVSRSA